MAEPEDCNVVHEQPTRGFKGAVDQILHFWPLLAVVGAAMLLVVNTLGKVYVTDIATQVHTNLAVSPANVQTLKSDITTIKAQLNSQAENDVEIRTQLGTIETRLDTLIRIQLENQ